MPTTTKNSFVRAFTQNNGVIDTNKLDANLKSTLKKVGGNEADLKRLAGQDGLIKGDKEAAQLFDYLDGFDVNGDRNSIRTEKNGVATKSGKLADALAKATKHAPPPPGGARFAGDSTFDKMAQGKAVLRQGASGDSVKTLQQSLIDLGHNIPGGVTGTYDTKTKAAVEAFQRDAHLSQDGAVGKNTLAALKAAAPAPGNKLERSAEYDKLYADGTLNMTIAMGYDESGGHISANRETLKGLKKQGYKPLDVSKLSAKQKAKLNLDGGRYDPNAEYFHMKFKDPKTKKDVDSVVRVITPFTGGAKARASYEKALQEDEVVLYTGHARYGTGPDFDDIHNGEGNFVINEKGNKKHSKPPEKLKKAIKGRGTDLDQLSKRPPYQVIVMQACSTTEYLDSMRDGSKFAGRNDTNTDIIATNNVTWVGASAEHNLGFLKGFTSRQSNRAMLDQHNEIEMNYSRRIGQPPDEHNNTFASSGFLNNAANTEVPR